MAIANTYLAGNGVQLGTSHFDLQAQKPLDARTTVPVYAGLQALIDGKAAYEGMIVYDEETKKTYQAQLVEGVLTFVVFGTGGGGGSDTSNIGPIPEADILALFN